ncbi:MAG: hypothetical protein ACRDZT_02435 [Acidimicrobiales bacterium]
MSDGEGPELVVGGRPPPTDRSELEGLTDLVKLARPERVLAELRDLAASRPAEARLQASHRLADHVFSSSEGVLRAAGISAEDVRSAFSGAGREIWLFVVGDRGWGQLAPALTGRLARRLPTRGGQGAP